MFIKENKEFEPFTQNIATPQVVLFTGGRDSTLTASILMMQGIPVCLVSANSGTSIHGEIRKYRIKELKKRFGTELLHDYQILNVSGTFRNIALVDIENDILTDKKNLIVLGEKIAILCHVINFCLRNNYSIVNCGYTKYQQDFPEQRQISINYFSNLLHKYNIQLNYPIYNQATTIEYVKYKLMQLGLSNKPLEGSTIFSDTFSIATDQVISNYILRKIPLFEKNIEFLTQGSLNDITNQINIA